MGIKEDPDTLALETAQAALGDLLKDWGIPLTKSQRTQIVHLAVCRWLGARVVHWSHDRSIAGIGAPDAYSVGFAEAVLPQIAGADFDFTTPLFDWNKADVSRLFATAYDAISEQKAVTMEDPDPVPFEVTA